MRADCWAVAVKEIIVDTSNMALRLQFIKMDIYSMFTKYN
jgi:hypothetical protein